MLSLLYAYLIAPRGFRRVLRWLALCLFLVVLVIVIMLFWRVLRTLPEHRGSILRPRPHQPLSPDFIRDHAHRHYRPKETL